MSSDQKPRSPVDQLELGRSFYAALDLDVRHFAAVWHSFNVGRLLANDLNAISGRYGMSIADFHLLGALMIDGEHTMRASDVAAALNVSAAVVSGRIARLIRKGLLRRKRIEHDRRAFVLTITSAGIEQVVIIGNALEAEGRFVRHYRCLAQADREALDRIMGELHDLMNRDFFPVCR